MSTRKRHLPEWFTRWYMDKVAGRYCPCEWPIKSRTLIALCAWIDDEEERHNFIRFAAFHIHNYQSCVVTNSGNTAVTTQRIRFYRRRHNGSQVER